MAALITRPTKDLDFFTQPSVGSVTRARDEFEEVIRGRGWTVERIRTARRSVDSWCLDPRISLVDLAVDSPPTGPPSMTFMGPTLDPLELGGRKLVALFDRAEARDFADVFILAQRFGKQAMVEQARQVDAGSRSRSWQR